MAYMDPGNYGTDIQAGASFNYGLLWVVWMANFMAMLLQYLSGKLGIATGKDLAGLVRESLHSKFDVYLNWIGAEAAAAATDLAEYLGTVIASYRSLDPLYWTFSSVSSAIQVSSNQDPFCHIQ
jgi:manganese transport protein